MEALLVVVALALALGLGLAPIVRRRRHAVSPERPGPGVRTDDSHTEAIDSQQAEIEEIFARVDAEESSGLESMLRVRANDLIARRVPVRRIREAPAPRVARIAFSNGVIVLVATSAPGDLVRMARAMTVTSVVLERMTSTPQGPVLRFVWRGDQRLEVYAVGLDQAD